MPTFTAFTTLNGKEGAEQIGLAVENMTPEPYGVGVFEIEDGSGNWEVGGYFLEAPDVAGLELLTAAFDANPFVVSELPEKDWVAHVRRELAPVEAGRYFVYGSHDADKVPDGSTPLLIEAAMAFGTGHHGTTLGCLTAFDELVNDGFKGGQVVDIGCGTAVLAMAAAKTFGVKVWASDIDPVAVDVARTNAAANGLSQNVECIEAAGFDHPVLAGAAPFDLIFANILKGPLIDLAPVFSEKNQDGGFLVLSGILNEQADDVVAVYSQNGYNLGSVKQIGDWTTLTLLKKDRE